MTENSEYDALGELFRRQLENHRIPVDVNDWNEIERRLSKRKNKSAILWLWSVGTAVAAASVAALLIIKQPAMPDEATIMAVSQQVAAETTETTNQELIPIKNNLLAEFQPTGNENQTNTIEFVATLESEETEKTAMVASGEPFGVQSFDNSAINQEAKADEDRSPIAQTENEIPILDISLIGVKTEENNAEVKKTDKWLLAAAFGMSGYSESVSGEPKDLFDAMDRPAGWENMGSGNKFASSKSSNVQSFENMSRESFTNITHRLPLSFGLTVRKSLGKNSGVETGLIYTYLASHYEWSGYDVQQSLHYMGIPVNMVVYIVNSNPNWRIYFSGGGTVEKGLRAIYRQEKQIPREHRITTVRSSIYGLQLSLNSALGVNYRLGNNFGIYFEPRAGYSFDCNQPISIRTEWPFHYGINLGLNYQL